MAHPRRVRERTEHVEHRTKPKLATDRTDVSQRRVKVGCEEESDPGLVDAPANAVRRQRDHHTERLENVSAPTS